MFCAMRCKSQQVSSCSSLGFFSVSFFFLVSQSLLKCVNEVSFTLIQNQAKKSSLVSGNRSGEIFFITYRPHKPNVYENIYFLFQKKQTQTKKFPLANLFVGIYVFLLQSITDRAVKFMKKIFCYRLDFVWPYISFIIYNQKARPLSMVTMFVFFHSFITLVMMLCFYHSEESHFYIVTYILSYLHGSIS